MKRKLSLIVLLFVGLMWWNWPRPRYFLVNLGIQVPSEAKVSHHSSSNLTSESHFVKVVLPVNQINAFTSQFSRKQRYRNESEYLKQHYKAFISGHEDFFPRKPRAFSGGSFLLMHSHYPYLFEYIVDKDSKEEIKVYIHVFSPDN